MFHGWQQVVLDNFTPFGAAATFAYETDDTQMMVLAVGGSFQMPPAGRIHDRPLTLAGVQPPPPMADLHFDNPATSTLRMPSQGTPLRPSPEIYLQGSAWAPRGHAVTRVQTWVRVGSCRKDVHVVGDRCWTHGLIGLRASAPALFTNMPLVYERVFGGTVRTSSNNILMQEPRNPIGRGLYASAKDALDQPLHNIEKPGESISDWSDHMTPWGYGPVPGAWQPRLAFAGTYNTEWAQTRLPLWPKDVDRRFFNAASPGLVFDGPLSAGEQVVLQGFDPDGYIAFTLPQLHVVVKSYFGDRVERSLMTLGSVSFDVDSHLVTFFWHHAVPVGQGRRAHLGSAVRLFESWESLP
jgi:hypothetical protein